MSFCSVYDVSAFAPLPIAAAAVLSILLGKSPASLAVFVTLFRPDLLAEAKLSRLA